MPAATTDLIAGGVDELLAPLLARRGVTTVSEAEQFLNPSETQLLDPFGLAGMEGAVERLLLARRRSERVAIVGDYDVDGVTATALLSAVLAAHGIDVTAIIPHRLHDGYGFQVAQVELAEQAGAKLIVTVDCGTTSIDSVQAALDADIDVIVTDHHLPGPDFPGKAHLINPHRPDCNYAFPWLSGVGLALKLALGLAARSGRDLPLASLLRMACLGTVADVVPIVGENRVITALGLRALEQTSSPGLRALFEVSGIKPPFRSDDIGFRMGPRINAAGRLDSAQAALDLLLGRDEEQCRALAEHLDGLNRERQAEELRVVDEAREMFLERSPTPGVLLAWSPEWHRGVVGIAAGRLAREFHRPTVLLAQEGDLATGSGRSVPGISLHGFLERYADQYQRFGGHDAAIGMTVACDSLESLRGQWEKDADWPEESLQPRHEHEIDLRPGEVTPELFRRLARLEPHGQHNSKPMVRLTPLEIPGGPVEFGAEHVKARAVDADGGSGALWLVGWRWRARAAELTGKIEAIGYLNWDSFLNWPSLTLTDVRPSMR